MLPFTHDQFVEVFSKYNAAVFPAQFVAYLLGAVAVWLVFSRSRRGDRVISAILAVMWLWTGVAYHGLFFSTINPSALAFAGAFVIEGGLLFTFGVVRNDLVYAAPATPAGWIGAALVAYAALLYPLVGMLAGASYPAMPIFGITPCPVTLFTFGFFLLARRVPLWLMIIPVLWSLVGGSAAFLLGVPQDWVLLISGLVSIGLIYRPGSRGGRRPLATN